MALVQRIVMACAVGGTLGISFGCGKSTATTPPSIASFSPLQGLAGNYILTIMGSGFTGTTAVTINGLAANPFAINSDSQITAFVPVAASTGVITVANAGGTSTTSTSFFIVPVISSLSATTLNAGGTVTINGSGFEGAISPLVVFGPPGSGSPGSTNQAVFTVNNANQITTTLPSGMLPGSGYVFTITVPGPNGGFISNNPAGTTTNPAFTIQ